MLLQEGFNQDWRSEVGKLIDTEQRFSEEDICRVILNSGAVEIRDVGAGEEPFLYSSGYWGPGYVNIKGLVGQEEVFKFLVKQEALKLVDSGTPFDFIAGNATGGMIPAYQLREDLQDLTGRRIPYVYVRGARKQMGHREHITGIDGPYTPPGSSALVVEELINFAQTTTNSALVLRREGRVADDAATILHYMNPKALSLLKETEVNVVQLTTLPKLLEVAELEGKFSPRAINDYKSFLDDPPAWQEQRGLKSVQL